MRATGSRLFLIALLAPLLGAGCASSQTGGLNIRQNVHVPPCPQFQLRDSGNFTFDITPAGGTIDMGDGSLLVFAPGAVTVDTRYWVRYLLQNVTNGPRVAGIEIQRLSGHDGAFAEPVTLRLSYARCGWTNSDHLFIVQTHPMPGSEGGSNSQSGQWVETMIGHFTGFAIAM